MEEYAIDLSGIPEVMFNPRAEILKMIQKEDIRGLMVKAAELHGHLCSFVTLGVRAGCLAVRNLGEEVIDGMEKVTCIIECNNCFSDGVQLSTGCTFGNNALIYRDLGKTCFTLLKREGKAIRVSVHPQAREKLQNIQEKIYPGASALFEKVVTKRCGTPEEGELLKKLFLRVSYELLTIPDEELLIVRELQIQPEQYAPIFKSYACAKCGEMIMETRARLENDRIVCIPCRGDNFFQLDGSGINQKKYPHETAKTLIKD